MSTTTPQLPPQPAAAYGDHATPHAVPMRVLLSVYATLVVLTAITVAVTYVNLGSFNILLALAIAVVKGSLVVMYFMHLRYDNLFNGIVLVTALVFVALFIGIAVLDTRENMPVMQPPPGVSVQP